MFSEQWTRSCSYDISLRRVNSMDKPNGRLVLVSYTHCCASTSSLSTWWSSRALHFPFWVGRSHLRACFPLICIQRLSQPNFATQPCPWQDNWNTRGSSIPVLSY